MSYARGMRDASDETLMQQYAAGDLSAFEALYARYRGPLYRYILRQVSDPATANDLYQGSWEKVIRARRS
ncbi:MAG TPA: sigma factor, partial [Afifellaceae bacterium]|nr:sigma factor [Afifellaceae bacterium]